MSNIISRRNNIPEVPDTTRLFHSDPVAGNLVNQILKALRNQAQGLPQQHARTHLGFIGDVQAGAYGGDGLFSKATPEPVVFGGAGQVGTPKLGAAAEDHVHAFDPGPLQDLLDSIRDGVLQVSDDALRRLLEQILLELFGIDALMLRLLELRPVAASSVASGDDEALALAFLGL